MTRNKSQLINKTAMKLYDVKCHYLEATVHYFNYQYLVNSEFICETSVTSILQKKKLDRHSIERLKELRDKH